MKFQKLCYAILGGALLLVASCSDGEDGQNGLPGADGLSCWDANNNGNADPEEDLNQDGNFNALDCTGANGAKGFNGLYGTEGISCWDTNVIGVGDDEEDLNQDGNFDAQDCQGTNGENGADGINCWDTNGNGVADAEEDVNEDGNFNAMDCQGANGDDGDDGENGTSCWDTNGNGVGDADEDLNEDGNFNALDCQGDDGADGNANVQRFDILLDGFSDNFLIIDINDEALPVSDFVYITYVLDADGGGGNWYEVPGFLSINNNNDRYVQRTINDNFDEFTFRFFSSIDLTTQLVIPEGELLALRYFAIRVNEDQASRAGSKGVYDDLKAAGVDVSDYHQVAKRFGFTD